MKNKKIMTKKVKSFSAISQLRVEEDYAFHALVIKLLSEYGLEGVEEVNEKYKDVFAKFAVAIKLRRKSVHTTEMRNADTKLASVLRCVRAYAKVMLSFPEEGKRQIAQSVYALFEGNDVLASRSYEDKYGGIEVILSALEEMGDDVLEFFGILPWVEELRRVTDEFMQARIARVEEKTERVNGLSRLRRVEADAVFERLVALVNAFSLIYSLEEYSLFIDSLNELIDEQLEKLSSRHKRADGKEGTGQ